MEFGTIEGFTTVPGSGLAMLLVRDDAGEQVAIPCDAAATVRALTHFVPGLLRGGASVRVRLLEGVRVRLALDDIGILASIRSEGDGDEGDSDAVDCGSGR